MMGLVNPLLNGVFDLLMRPFQLESAWPGLIAASFLIAVVLVGLFGWTSSPQGILRARNRFLARTLELLLFQHDLRVSLTSCGRLFVANFAYLFQFLWPMAVGLLPMVVLFVQLEAWFDRRPLQPGEVAVLTVAVNPQQAVLSTPVEIELPENVRLDSQPVRTPIRNEVAWRIRAVADGSSPVGVRLGDVYESKTLVVGSQLMRVSPRRVSAGLVSQFFAPSEPPLADTSPIRRIEITYPHRELAIGFSEISWVVAAVVLMMVFSLLLGPVFGVRIA